MAYSETFFSVLPTPEEKSSRKRKYYIFRASADPESAVRDIASKYCKQQTIKALLDPLKCVMQLQKIMSGTSHMENLSDLVAICFVFTYRNIQSQSQSIGLLKHCLNNNFKFDDEELDLMVKSMIDDPPQSHRDMNFCSQVVALICKQSKYCAKLLLERFKEKKLSESQVKFLTEISKEICLNPTNFTQNEIEILRTPLVADPTIVKEKKIKNTPTMKKMEQAEMKTKVNTYYSRFKSYQNVLFIILTIILLLAIVSIL
ncbi:hypothetical protein TRFO_37679 [Tritrichomonas foetus]|uniref:Uncharacterized protein n=1 Tax=Tritrichomonas foetus TaxID=1144522 RepID=A0A1J4JAE2_9EUKA|nr:hypothetical protein TRFO_37679 [Tritrichomonas foetus]|eukprot:OHS96146.1 hypothetical protein TRFO_37679 [Tritrichomonas foetus]